MYSDTVLDHFGNPRNIGRPMRVDARGVAGNPESGPFTVLYIGLEGRTIAHVGFETYGCAASIAAGSLLTELLKGRSIEDVESIDATVILEKLGGLPLGKRQCADLAITAFRDALAKLRDAESAA